MQVSPVFTYYCDNAESNVNYRLYLDVVLKSDGVWECYVGAQIVLDCPIPDLSAWSGRNVLDSAQDAREAKKTLRAIVKDL